MIKDYQALTANAHRVNTLSDVLTQYFAGTNEQLKALNLGLEAWVKIDDRFQLGYAKVYGTWGLAIKTSTDTWQISESPRDARIASVSSMHYLIDELTKVAGDYADRINTAVDQLRGALE